MMMKYFHIHITMLFGMLLLVLLSCCKKDTCPTCPSPPTDSTSHNFSWQTYALGDGTSSSTLYDVAIINDTLAYAVGEIYRNDTSFNVAKWDGRTWQLMRIMFDYQGSESFSYLNSILAFDSNDIWFEGGIHWDGNKFNSSPMNISFPSHVNKMWGTSSSDIYAVGNSGLIAHYDGSSWTKIASGTSLDFHDIYGTTNTSNGTTEILAVAGNPLISKERKIVSLSGNTATALSDHGIDWALLSVWFVPSKLYWVVGDGMYEKQPCLGSSTWTRNDATGYTTYKVRGNGVNDVFACGAYGEMIHYNGISWKSYMTQTYLFYGMFWSLAVTNTIVIAVGENNQQAVVYIGKCPTP
jgi:hypothetical protein